MAAEGIKKVVSHVTCTICHELYTKPKYLSCYHSYCEECLAKLLKGSDITCPECKKTSAIPTGGIKLLPNNLLINRIVEEVTLSEKVTGEGEVHCDVCIRDDPAVILCFDCGVLLCNHCYEYHKYNKEYNCHKMQQLKELREEKKDICISPKVKPMLCQEHEMELNFYCDTCDQLVCHYCTITDHNGHEHNTVKRMANRHRIELEEIVEPVEEMITGLSQTHQKVMANQDNIQMQINEVDHQIDEYYEQLQRTLLQQKEDLKKELHKLFTQKKKLISKQLQETDHIQAQLQSMKELNNAVKNGSDQEALFVKRQVTEDVKRLTDCYKNLKIEPVKSVSMLFCPVKEYQDYFPQFANLFYGDAVPFNSSVENIPSLAYANKNVKFTIVTKNAEGNVCSKGGSKVIAQARSSNTGDTIPVAIRDNKDGSYFASFVSNEAGEVRLSVNINGKHINGSPCSVSVRRNYHAVSIPNKIVNLGGTMGEPWGIAFGKDGVWAVTDHSDHCVYIFDSQDQLVTKFGSKGIGDGQFHCPAGLAFDADNHLYVVCRYNHRVQKFLVNGEYVLQFSYKGLRNGQLDCPLGITVHNEKVYIADQCNGCVSVFYCDGKYSHTIGLGNLSTAIFDVTINGNNNQLLVADKRNHCISIFTLDGSHVGNIGIKGSDKGQLYCPAGVTVDEYGCILVIEGVNHRVSIFDKDGIFIHCFGSKGSAKGQFHTNESLGIALSPDGSIFISDYHNKRIQIYSNF